MSYKAWRDMLADPRYAPSTGMLRDYLELTDGLESPTPYHIWSFISLFGALSGRRIHIDHGALGREFLNMGIILIGFPAIRKSKAISVLQKFAHGLPLQFGPTDTAGQRQGIMSAMLPRWQYDHLAEKEEFDLTDMTLEALGDLDTTGIQSHLPNGRLPASSELYFMSKELGRLMASPSREMLDFFNDLIDGEPVHYQIKTQTIKIPQPLMNLIGATTPADLGQMIYKGGVDHGFISRLIFVYADELAGRNPIPREWDATDRDRRERMLAQIEETFERVDGRLELSDSAERTYTNIYDYDPAISDARLRPYAGRRATHLIKLSGLVALMRGAEQQRIIASDVRFAHALLCMTEGLMGRAFYGMDTRDIMKIQLAAFGFLEGQPNFSADRSRVENNLTHHGDRTTILNALNVLSGEKKIVESGGNLKITTEVKDMAWRKPFIQFNGNPGPDEFVTMSGGVK